MMVARVGTTGGVRAGEEPPGLHEGRRCGRGGDLVEESTDRRAAGRSGL